MYSTPIDLCAIPTAKSPDGQYNFDNPPSLGPTIISLGVVLCPIAVILTTGRIYTNRRRLLGADYFTIAACVFNIGFMGILMTYWKMYRHEWDIPLCWFTSSYFKKLYVQETFFFPVYFTSKVAILLLYRQLFGVKRWMRIAVDGGIVFTFALYFPNIPLAAIYSAPRVGETWSSMLTSDGPFKMIPYSIAMASGSTLLDIYLFILPLTTISRLHMPLARRIQLLGVFGTALFGVVASALSLVYRVKLMHASDTLWPQSIVSICALIESNVAIIVGCMPGFAQFLKVQAGGSSFLSSLRSFVRGAMARGSSNMSPREQASVGPDNSKLTPWTAPLPTSKRRNNYYEMSDTMLLYSQNTASDHRREPIRSSQDEIIRSVDIPQQWHFRPDSRENLVRPNNTYQRPDDINR